jgi:hypothetical protein
MSRLRLIAGLLVTAALVAVAVSALVGPAVAAPAHPAVAGHVNATLGINGHGTHKRLRLTITLDGATRLDAIVTSRSCPGGCSAVGLGTSKAPLRVVALRHGAVPDVIVGLYSGGAHCCFIDQVYRLDPNTNRFVKIEHDFLDSGARILDLNGDNSYEFLSADARISNAGFTDFADSPAPLQIFTVQRNAFRDITRKYPARLKADAARWLKAFHHHYGNGRGFIAAWAADEDLLGHPGLVSSQLAGALKAGHLRVPRSFGGPSAAKFVTQLQALLRRLGYTR